MPVFSMFFNLRRNIIPNSIYMKKLLFVAALVALASCTHKTYTEATRADGATVKHVAIAPGTKITTAAGGCIDSTKAAAACQAK
ncbi:hypothetical protein [Salmonella enterica]|uniref:hypothetical protein n=1 Tax=Salmonella enterica TaxID=28901 RepID=UPI003AACDC2C